MGRGGNLFKSTMGLSGVTILSRILGLVRDILMSRIIGGGLLMSVWTFASMIPNLMRRILGEGALGTALVPIISHTLEKEGQEAARKKFSTILIWLTFLLVLITVAVAAAALLLEPHVTTERWKLTLLILPAVMPYCIMICLVGVVTSLLNSLKWFSIPALASLLLNLFLIGALLLFAPGLKGSMEGLLYLLTEAVLLSGAVELLILGFLLKKAGMPPLFSKGTLLNFPAIREIYTVALPGLIGMSALQVSKLCDDSIAMYISDHAKSALYYSDRLIYLPIGVFAVAFGTVSLSLMSSLAGSGRCKTMLILMFDSLRQLLFITIPLGVFILFFGRDCIRILFFGGKFDIQALDETSIALFWYSLGIPAFAAVKVVVSGFYSRKEMRTPMIVSVCCIVLNLILNLLLMRPMKQGGIALATTVTFYLNNLILLYLLKKQFGRIPLKSTAFLFAKSAVISLASAYCAWYCYQKIAALPFGKLLPNMLIPFCAAAAVFGILYAGSAYLLRIREMRSVIKKLLRKR